MEKIKNLYVIAALATIGGLIQGFDVSSMSAIIGTPQYKAYFNSPDATKQGGITASMAGGSLLGSLFSTVISDRFGRRDSMFVACIIWFVGSTLMCAVQDVAMLIVSRIVNGFAVGILTSQGPIYIAEMSLPKNRGRLLSLQQWMITWGILIMYFISYGCSFIDGIASFRLPWGIQIIPGAVLFASIPFMPRSPRWLASKDRWDEAVRVLAAVHGEGDIDNPLVIAQIEEIKEKLEIERKYSNSSWTELIHPRNIVQVHCAIFSHIWSQLSGTNAAMYYIVYIFEMAGLSGNKNLLSASIQYIINVAMTLPALLFIDRWPRRYVMMTGSFLMAIWLFSQGAVMASYGRHVPGGLPKEPTVTWVLPSDSNASRAVIAISYLFVASYASTWGPVGWIYPAEIIPLSIRSKAVSVATAFNWAMNFALTFFTPPAFKNIQWKIYMIFGTFCMTAFFHVFFLFQESCGKTLEEMDEIFAENLWAFKTKRTGTRLAQDIEDAKGRSLDLKDDGHEVQVLPKAYDI